MKPRLIAPIPIYIEQIEPDQTAQFDPYTKEPIGDVARAPAIRVLGQFQPDKTDDPDASSGGVVLESKGYILFQYMDLVRAGIQIRRGDKVIQIGEGLYKEEVEFYIKGTRRAGHYARLKGGAFLKAWYSDRHPSRK